MIATDEQIAHVNELLGDCLYLIRQDANEIAQIRKDLRLMGERQIIELQTMQARVHILEAAVDRILKQWENEANV